MPALSMFYGIIVRMQSEKGIRHNLPHIHCEFSGEEVVLDLNGNVLEGNFPKRQLDILKGWVAIHKEELEANWTLLSNGEKFFKIEPLK